MIVQFTSSYYSVNIFPVLDLETPTLTALNDDSCELKKTTRTSTGGASLISGEGKVKERPRN